MMHVFSICFKTKLYVRFWLFKLTNTFSEFSFYFPKHCSSPSVKSCTLLFIDAPSQESQHHVLHILGAQVKPDLILSLPLSFSNALSSFRGWYLMCYTFFLSLSSGSKSPWPCTTAFSQSRLLWNSPLLKCVTYTICTSPTQTPSLIWGQVNWLLRMENFQSD